jgi:formate dehydrogenase maturation protein FdhE
VIDAEERVARACEQRAARAEGLAARGSAASEPLRFAEGLFRAQAACARRLSTDFARAVEAARPVIDYVAARGPAPLAAQAREFDPDRLRAYWGGLSEFDYLARAALQPWARFLRERGIAPGRPEGPCTCCGGAPWIAARRGGGPNSDGAARSLICALCALEWQTPRIKCPACGEEDPRKLPHYGAPEHPTARIEACETCRAYVKSLDLTQDARLVPEVDDLVSISLDLWAAEQQFHRLEPGLAGL